MSNIDRLLNPRVTSARAAQLAFLGVVALVFLASATMTVIWCASMPAMVEMRMPGQTWLDAAASFLGMWASMMVAMMLPALAPALWRYREAVRRVDLSRAGRLTLLTGLGYFSVWTLLGAVAFPLGVMLVEIEMRQPLLSQAVPLVVGLIILSAGMLQLTAWKARQLVCCRKTSLCARTLRASPAAAWRHGLQLGLQCCRCCGNLMIISLVIGVMDLRAMAVVALAVTSERLAPAGERIRCVIGIASIGTGLCLMARAMGIA